jgi:hypothetical protein
LLKTTLALLTYESTGVPIYEADLAKSDGGVALSGWCTSYLRHVSRGLAKGGGPFVLVVDTHRFFGGPALSVRDRLEHAFGPMGFSSHSVGCFGTISVVIFESVSEACGPGRP